MAEEIELKYLVEDTEIITKVNQLVQQLKLPCEHSIKCLKNQYYDTKDLTFRALDFGLRTRQYQSIQGTSHEQTIKTAGHVVGGLHKRPEYNVDIVDNYPDLSLFPEEIWPSHVQVSKLQQSLVCLFSTDFERNTWHLTLEDGVIIELVYDVGEIKSVQSSVDINEIELELITGQQEHLFEFANKLFQAIKLRPGIDSKAARGYGLFHRSIATYPKHLPLIAINESNDLSEVFYQGMSESLTHLQQSVSGYMAKPCFERLAVFVDSLILIRHGFWLFEDLFSNGELAEDLRKDLSHFIKLFSWVDNAQFFSVLMNKSGAYRKKIEYSQQLVEQLKLENRRFPDEEQVKKLLVSEKFNHLQLGLLKLILSKTIEVKQLDKDNRSLARDKLEESLKQAHLNVQGDAYMDVAQALLEQRKLLIRSLLTGNWLGNLFEDSIRQNYRNAWLDVLAGINELQTLWLLDVQLDSLTPRNEKLCTWFDIKIEHLVETISQSHQHALSIVPYWRE